MESIYFVMTWLCHRTCPHCYEDRFRPYYGEDLKKVVRESRENTPRILENFPDRMVYLDRADSLHEKRGRIILAGGEILLDPVRESVLYPAIDQLQSKYRRQGGADLIVQTTGDILTEKHIVELLEHEVSTISVSGLDEYHAGLEKAEARDQLREKLTRLFLKYDMEELTSVPRRSDRHYFHFFGATPESWIGKLWPRGRAAVNELSTATLADNFCNRWSGGLHFLDRLHSGSEVSIDPAGNVFPCCIKTKAPVGNLLERKLEHILDSLAGNPVYEAISLGQPERMGITHGWPVEKFLEKSRTVLASGRVYQNLCVGCDAFHKEVLMPKQDQLVEIGKRSQSI